RPNASNPRAIADASACLEVAVTGFSLWQLLNQPQPFDGGDQSDAVQQHQAASQAIGQSLIDMWDRGQAAAPASPNWSSGLGDAATYPYGSPGSVAFGGQGKINMRSYPP